MGRVADYTFNHFLDFDDLKRIRNEWTGFYHEAYRSAEFDDRFGFSALDDGELKKRAITSMEAAGKYRPHEAITGTIEKVTRIYNLLRLGLLVGALLAGSAIFGVLEFLLAFTTQIETLLIASIPTNLWIIGMVYLYLLRTDDTFVQEFNKRMRFGANDIVRAERDSELLFGYYLWNNGLCDSKKVPALLILYLILLLSENLYQYIMRTVSDNLERFIDRRTFREAFKTAYRIERTEHSEV